MGNLFQQHCGPSLDSTGIYLLPNTVPAACDVKHRKPAAVTALVVVNSHGNGYTSRGGRQGNDTPIYLYVLRKGRFLPYFLSS
jgi:hypothetical protein